MTTPPHSPREHHGLPVAGYAPQSDAKVSKVNELKADEERLLRKLDAMARENDVQANDDATAVYDARWMAIARSHFQEGFMALNRSVFQPQRVNLPED